MPTLSCELFFGGDSGMGVKWSIIEGEAHIDIMVYPEIYTYYQWIGLGLKRYEDGTDMVNGDYYTIVIKEFVLEDSFGETNGAPVADTELGGEYDLLRGPVDKEQDTDMRIYGFRRWADTGDIYDVELFYGNTFYWQWAYGMVDEEGNLLMHEHQGYVEFILEECEVTEIFG